jgi:hypothetical protein
MKRNRRLQGQKQGQRQKLTADFSTAAAKCASFVEMTILVVLESVLESVQKLKAGINFTDGPIRTGNGQDRSRSLRFAAG